MLSVSGEVGFARASLIHGGGVLLITKVDARTSLVVFFI